LGGSLLQLLGSFLQLASLTTKETRKPVKKRETNGKSIKEEAANQ
jgi:hypothetical protein